MCKIETRDIKAIIFSVVKYSAYNAGYMVN